MAMTDRVERAGTLTFLFTDIVGSTRVAQSLGDDAWFALLHDHFADLRALVATHGGREVKLCGDGIMAVFPDPQEAVLCGTAMQAGLREPLLARVGVHTGEAIASDGDYFGHEVNVAARVAAAADAGEVVVSDAVRSQCVGLAFGPRRLTELRGVPGVHELHPVETPTPERPPHATGSTALFPLAPTMARPEHTQFVGRDAELASALACWHRTRDGGPRLVVVEGEPGIGKSRLAREVARIAFGEGAIVLHGRCDESGGLPYQPVVEAGTAVFDAIGAVGVTQLIGRRSRDLARLLPDLGDIGPVGASPASEDPGAERHLLFRAITDLFRNLTRLRPVLLVIDDLHWADESTLALLRHLARFLPSDAPILVLATNRDTDLGTGVPGLLRDLARDGLADVVHLEGLDIDAVASVAAPGLDAVPVFELTGGNPLFVEELSRAAAEGLPDGAVRRYGTVQDFIERRVDRLSVGAAEALRYAAIVGLEFDVELVAAACDSSADHIAEQLDEAIGARLVTDLNLAGRLRFHHGMVAEVLAQSLGARRRARAHLRVAEVLEHRNGRPTDIANHLLAAVPMAPAGLVAGACLKAADAALVALAWEEAAKVSERALAVLEASDEPADLRLQFDLLLVLGTAVDALGRTERRDDVYLRAIEVARAAGSGDRLAEAVLGFAARGWERAWHKPDEHLRSVLQEALDHPGFDDDRLRARLLSALAICTAVSHAGPSDRYATEALELARRSGDYVALHHALNWQAVSAPTPDRRAAACEEMLTAATALGDPIRETESRYLSIQSALERGDMTAARNHLAIYERLATELHRPAQRFGAAAWRAVLAELAGDLSVAESVLVAALPEATSAGPNAMGIFANVFASIRREQGRAGEVVGSIAAVADDESMQHPVWDVGRAFLLAESGDLEEARQGYDRLAAVGFELPPDPSSTFTLLLAAELAWLLDDSAGAAILTRWLEPVADMFAVAGIGGACVGSMHRPFGTVLSLCGRHDAAIDELEAALRADTNIESRVCVSHDQVLLADALRRRGTDADKLRASTLLEASTVTATAGGFAEVLRRAGVVRARLDA